jgi:hypothetical protein
MMTVTITSILLFPFLNWEHTLQTSQWWEFAVDWGSLLCGQVLSVTMEITYILVDHKILLCWVHTDSVFRVVPLKMPISAVLQVSAGLKHILALVKDPQGKTEVLSMGKNNYGQMGRDNGRSRFKMTHTETVRL